MGEKNGNSNTLRINTLGQFSVFRGGVNLTKEHSRSRRPWLLFQYLISNPGKVLPGELVIETLWPEMEIKDPQHALRNLVYRLRRFIGDKKEGEHYIIYTQGNYAFNPRSNYWMDFEVMEDLSNKAFTLQDDDPEKIDLLEKAHNLYGGEYLPSRPYEEWTINLRNYFQRLYLKIAHELSRLLMEKEAWEETISVCERALEFEPFEDNIHRSYIEALINSDHKVQAKNHYFQTNSFFKKELGIKLNFEIEDLMKNSNEVNPVSKPTTWIDFQEVIEEKEEGKGAFLCDGENFRMIYQLEERRAERNIRQSSLVSFEFIPPKGKEIPEEMIKERSEKFQEVLLNSLRKGDVICPSKPGEFLLLLVDVPPDKVDNILERLAGRYYDVNPDDEFRLNVKQRPLISGTTIKKR